MFHFVQVTAELFDILSGKSDVDHPLCEVWLVTIVCIVSVVSFGQNYNNTCIILSFFTYLTSGIMIHLCQKFTPVAKRKITYLSCCTIIHNVKLLNSGVCIFIFAILVYRNAQMGCLIS